MTKSRTWIAGTALVLAGLLIPATTWVHLLRTPPPDLEQKLLLGAVYFKVGLVVLGAAFVFLGWYSSVGPLGTYAPRVRARRRGELAVLSIILLVATALRLYQLDRGVWYDEIMTYVRYSPLTFGELVSTYNSENHHVAYSLLMKLALGVTGDTPWSLRLPAAMFGVGSLWALFVFARSVVGPREALLSTALLAVSYHVAHSIASRLSRHHGSNPGGLRSYETIPRYVEWRCCCRLSVRSLVAARPPAYWSAKLEGGGLLSPVFDPPQ